MLLNPNFEKIKLFNLAGMSGGAAAIHAYLADTSNESNR